ncbi:N-acetylmuramoyl-L-alanine amidase family protein [Paenibacillus favisporus]|uniref:N-acetylmuramoyl-L-alanine amidase family protein n=1 Tax=Paenibacillus favisporus TaxID=221028 RepID=UPI002DB840F8|nr:N-acetylmuramoyl-L-alanine amidase family protein [Paenibacillus favisporus]MEC0174424.1 N-acetylmuramoyl-L-alanine amidase family protein [Paenibacillus favisporus]
MKKFLSLLFLSLFLLILLPHSISAASKPSKIVLDGQELVLPADVKVSIIDQSMMIPLRVVAENLKFQVNWDQRSRSVTIQQNAKAMLLTVGKKEAKVADQLVRLDTAPRNMNQSVVVPIRFVTEQMGLAVNWDNRNKTVYLTSPPQNPDQSKDPNSEPEADNTEPLTHVSQINYLNQQLVIRMDGQVTPKISTLANPARIVVDLPNTTFGALTQPLDSAMMGKLDVSGQPDVSEVRYSLFSRDPEQVRVVVELSQGNPASYHQEFIGDQLIIDLSGTGSDPQAPVSSGDENERKIVVIDAGHGGSDPGTTSISNKHEKDFNLALALKVQELLLKEPEIEVIMTRDSDVYPTRTERVQLANSLNADVFVSIHGNSVLESPQATGTETHYYQRSSSKQLADAIHKRLVQAMGLKDRGVKNTSLQVIRETDMAAVLLEVGFLSNVSDEQAMLSDTVQYKAAQAIVDGIKEYLSIT